VLEELNLLRQAKALNEEALAEIHDMYYQGIYRFFSFRMPDSQTAEDLTSEVFLRFLRAIRDKHAPPNTIRAWLFGAARNVAREYYRRSKKTETISMTETIPGGDSSLESGLSKRMDIQALGKAMERLTEDQRHVLALRFGYGLPIREVAEIINKSDAAVKMLQARAIVALTNQLDPQR
jgi:RNA polymerase sigma-70 factor (ECF subfamily)